MRTSVPAAALAERLCRPQRIGVFGHRGVGKTTLLTMLYREAVGGRLPELRLAAADARTANYLSDKILQLESGQPLPATLAETELRFHLYHRGTRVELLFKDYQGEHVELGRQEPIRDFLRDCDALWICLDAATVEAPEPRLRRQQEVEQLIEDYLAQEPQRTMDRPVALVLTKADLLGQEGDAPDSERWAGQFGMTRHALRTHCPRNDLFAVSSLGTDRRAGAERGADAPRSLRPPLAPRDLAGPLLWLAAALQERDRARLDQIWSLARNDVALLSRCVACFARRYPDSPAATAYRQRLREQVRRRRRQRAWAAVAAAAALLIGLWTYDLLGYQGARRFEAENAGDPATVLRRWQTFQTWHPTRHFLRPASARAEDDHLRGLQGQARDRERDERLAGLRRRADDPGADPESTWRQFETFCGDYPEVDVAGDLRQLRQAIKQRRDGEVARKARQAYDELINREQYGTELTELVEQASRFVGAYPDEALGAKVRERREAYLRRLEERDIEAARGYSAKQPLNFQTRRERYQHYLDRHPGGAFASEAESALRAIEGDWDRHDFRAVRDHFLARPGDVTELVARCRTYLAVHPQGQFTAAASELLRWSERVTASGDYRVVLRNGKFERKVAPYFSRGPKLSVEVEVNGVRYGPSPIVVNSCDPNWDYEFPRSVRWKLGDPVRVRVHEHSWKKSVAVEVASADGDPLGLRLLAGEVWSGGNWLRFETDFQLPELPKIE